MLLVVLQFPCFLKWGLSAISDHNFLFFQVFAAVTFGVCLGFKDGVEKASEFFAGYATCMLLNQCFRLLLSINIGIIVLKMFGSITICFINRLVCVFATWLGSVYFLRYVNFVWFIWGDNLVDKNYMNSQNDRILSVLCLMCMVLM